MILFATNNKKNFKDLLIWLTMFCLLLVGCSSNVKYENGFEYTNTPNMIMFGSRSDTDLFDKSSVTFDIYFGLYDVGYCEKYGTDPKMFYQKEGDETIFFGLYICDSNYSLSIVNDIEISDYKMIEKHYFVKEISQEDAFSEEYGFFADYRKGITYNHSEEITIPIEFFENETGSFAVKLIAFHKPIDGSESYYVTTVHYVEFEYTTINEDMIKVIF